MDEEARGILRQLGDKLDKLAEVLGRIEQRQIKTTAMVENVKAHEAPEVGSFGTTEAPPE